MVFFIPRSLEKSEGDIVIASVCPSVCPLCHLLLNRWKIFSQIWCVSYSHKGGVQRQFIFGPTPWGPAEGSKGPISFNFYYKVNFKDFYTKLCVCSHKLKVQNVSDGILILLPGSCPRGRNLERWGAKGVKKIQT